VDHFIRQLNLRFSLSKRVGDEAMEALLRHAWPGNVRELIHVLEQVVVLSDADVIGLQDLPAVIPGSGSTGPGAEAEQIPTLREVQRRHIFWVLEKAAGNRARAARLLGTSERTFYRLLERYRSTPDPGSRVKTPGREP
jgi:DNA-binding NtrC family response regulator